MKKKENTTPCESCQYFDYSEEEDCFTFRMDLDEDEFLAFMTKRTASCPYYKFYDEYKSVQKQN